MHAMDTGKFRPTSAMLKVGPARQDRKILAVLFAAAVCAWILFFAEKDREAKFAAQWPSDRIERLAQSPDEMENLQMLLARCAALKDAEPQDCCFGRTAYDRAISLRDRMEADALASRFGALAQPDRK